MKDITQRFFAFLIVLILLLPVSVSLAQGNVNKDIHLFQSNNYDSNISPRFYAEIGQKFTTFGSVNKSGTSAQVGIPIGKKAEVRVEQEYKYVWYDEHDCYGGASDTEVHGKYNITTKEKMQVSVGGKADIPIGSEKIGGGNFDFGAYGAARYQVSGDAILAGNVGIAGWETTTWNQMYDGAGIPTGVEEKKGVDFAFMTGIGLIYNMTENVNAIGEATLSVNGVTQSVISAGVDFKLPFGHAQAHVGFGLTESSPDFVGKVTLRFSF